MCSFGTASRCTGATGLMSWNARISSSSYTLRLGISPRTILQKMQFSVLMGKWGWIQAFRAAFLVDARNAFAAPQLGQHVVGPETRVGEHDEAVEPQVGRLANEGEFITTLRGQDRLGRLLADLLEDRVLALREQGRDVGTARLGALAGLERLGNPGQHVRRRS